MENRNTMVFALIAVTVILVLSLFVAYVCFDVLQSSAEATLKEWKLGGAFAGFVFTASLLTSLVIQIYRVVTIDQVKDMRRQISELQTKLIKGAPCPADYSIDVDERHKVVFARPKSWSPTNGLLYQYVDKTRPAGQFKPNFNVFLYTAQDLKEMQIDLVPAQLDAVYASLLEATIKPVKALITDYSEGEITDEYFHIEDLKSLKYIHTYTTSMLGVENLRLRQIGVFVHVPAVQAIFNFTFTDDVKTFLGSSEIFNTVIASIRFLTV